MSKTNAVGIEVNDDLCGHCSICSSLCPYEAISVDPTTSDVRLDVEKCQFCGLCYSACPVSAIKIAYYDYDTLLKRVKATALEKKTDTLVLMCRGNSPPTGSVEHMLEDLDCNVYVPLRVPCVGRVPVEFFLKSLTSGISRVLAIRCEDDFCRFKEGSRINNQRLLLTKQVLKELGYPNDTLRISTFSRKVVYETEKCVGCDKCVFICPYEAIEAEPFATPRILDEKCVGCGACALVCPHEAIQLDGFEYETTATLMKRYGAAVKQLKTTGVHPIVLVFCCQWSEFSALDYAMPALLNKKFVLMEIPCFKGLDPYLVVEALYNGFDGVLAVVCSDTDCKLEKGYDVAERNADALERVLNDLDLHERFELYTASPRNIQDFDKLLSSFILKVNSLPSLSLRKSPKAGE